MVRRAVELYQFPCPSIVCNKIEEVGVPKNDACYKCIICAPVRSFSLCVWESRGTGGAIVGLLLAGNTQLTCICEDGVVAAVIGEAHPGAQRELVQFGQRLLVLHGALVLDGELLGAALVVRDLCHARTPPQKQCEREESSVKRAQ